MKYAYLLLVGAAALSQGCVANDISFTIDRFVAIDTTTMCAADPTGMTSVAEGLLDVGLASISQQGYVLAPVVGNHLLEQANASTPELNAIQLIGFDVKLQPDANLANVIPPGQLQFFIPSAGGRLVPAAEAAAPIQVIPMTVVNELATAVAPGGSVMPLIVASVRPVGARSGSDLDGAFVDFPILICNDCLSHPTQACPAAGFPVAEVQLGGCFLQQDQSTTCCTKGGSILCGSAVPTSTP